MLWTYSVSSVIISNSESSLVQTHIGRPHVFLFFARLVNVNLRLIVHQNYTFEGYVVCVIQSEMTCSNPNWKDIMFCWIWSVYVAFASKALSVAASARNSSIFFSSDGDFNRTFTIFFFFFVYYFFPILILRGRIWK